MWGPRISIILPLVGNGVGRKTENTCFGLFIQEKTMVDNKLSLPVVPSRAANPHLSRHFNRKTVNISMGPGCSFGEAKQIEEPANISEYILLKQSDRSSLLLVHVLYVSCQQDMILEGLKSSLLIVNIARKFQFFDLSRSSTCLSKTTEIS